MPLLMLCPSPCPPPPNILPGLLVLKALARAIAFGEGGRSCGRLRRRHQDCLPANGTNGREFFYWRSFAWIRGQWGFVARQRDRVDAASKRKPMPSLRGS